MSLTAAEILAHPRLPQALRRQAATLVSLHTSNPRISSNFATQQRWLMAHLALALYFRSTAFFASQFLDAAVAEGVASRNTADAFLKEIEKYGYLTSSPAPHDRRVRLLAPAPVTLHMIIAWLAVHLTTLDALDDGRRVEALTAGRLTLAAIHPGIADGLLASEIIRAPAPTFSLFTWLNEGGIVMDWLFAGLAEVGPEVAQVPSTVTSFAEIGEQINLSSTHLVRKLRQAEAMGSLGWLGPRGRSTMWVSAAFRDEYQTQQAAKLAIIDAAFQGAIVAEPA